MAVLIDEKKCTSCGICVELCPGDLLTLDTKTRKAFVCDNSDCWNCLVCVKHCPVGAITLKLPKSIAPYDATLMPEMRKDKIVWTLIDADGKREKFEIKRKSAGGA